MISRRLLRWWWTTAVLLGLASTACAEPLTLSTRSRIRSVRDTNDWGIRQATATWEATRTAVVVCDMWDKHHCPDATERVGEMAPRMNEMIKAARARGCLIIHCPSDTMDFYKDHPGRKLAQSAPKVPTTIPLEGWCSLKPDVEAPLPIDDSDGGCDGCPDCPSFKAWSRQHPALEIQPGDAITDSAEAFYLMRQRGITNVIVMGVHINMCVLGRPFSIRQMIRQGQNVVLVRDMTDSMYNHRKRPFVSHFRGTELVVEHIEKYWCPSVTSSDFLGGPNFRFKADKPKRVTFVIGENEYRTWETLPVFTRNHLSIRGYRFEVVSASPKDGDGDFKNWEAIRNSDLLILSVRRRTAPPGMIQALRDHVAAGKPIVGIRTASHAFEIRGQTNTTPQTWPNFDDEILGADYQDHYGKGPGRETLVSMIPEAANHPVLTGIPATARFTSHLYRNRNLFRTVTPLLRGQTEDGKSEVEPVAWVNTRDNRRVFYTSLGSPEDFAEPTFQRLLLNGILWALDEFIPPAATPIVDYAGGWQRLKVPGTWDETSRNGLAAYDGIAWYRAWVKIPADWPAKAELFVEQVDDAHEAFLDGVRVGAAGAFPPAYQSGLGSGTAYPVTLRPGQSVLVAVRIFDNGGRGGFKGRAPEIRAGNRTLPLTGEWEFRTGDNPDWSKPANPPSKVDFDGAKTSASLPPATPPPASPAPQLAPLPPAEAALRFDIAPGLAWDQVLAEPDIAQPVFLTFDERGRMWVVEYRQYPHPAGLKMVSRDNFWRAVYDKVPPAPPNHFRGADRISIHEDSDGNGTFDRHSIFVDGLNIATSVAFGRGGVWVLNPPYLLFYPDANHDDKPDGDPEVRLTGFGLEDTHSVANSLRWGADGWLYGCQGSTVTGNILVHGPDGKPLAAKPVYSQGQNIWRYHPERRVYEVFSEGGGNAFGLEFDSAGRVFSGHNGGNTRGFHYQQGAYLQKGFDKHGPLSNPHAYGYFPAIPHPDVDRFTHNFVLYDSGALGEAYQGRLFGVEPLQGRIVLSEITRDGSTFRTRDLGHPVRSTDAFFRPVDIKLGPDGALYVCDWYDRQVNHYRNHEGQMDASNGRIYRLRHRDARPGSTPNLANLPTAQRVASLGHTNRLVRELNLRRLADQRDPAAVPLLRAQLNAPAPNVGPDLVLESLWALHQLGALDAPLRSVALRHPNPQVRLWTARFIGDHDPVPAELASQLAQIAANEPDVEVRSQLASTARRLPAVQSLPIVKALLSQDRDAADPRLPLLLWWAIEQHCASAPDAVLDLFTDRELWRAPVVHQHILHRLARRFTATGKPADLKFTTRLFTLSPSAEATARLTRGFEEATAGSPLPALPEELVLAMEKAGGESLLIGTRRARPAAVEQALARIRDDKAATSERIQLVQVLGEIQMPAAIPALLTLVRDAKPLDLRRAALGALQSFNDPAIASELLTQLPSHPPALQPVTLAALASRARWAEALLTALDAGRIPVASVPTDLARKLKALPGESTARLTARLWPQLRQPTSAELEREILRLAEVINLATGSPYPGKKLFLERCGTCHKLFTKGGDVGPDLTVYQRTDLPNLLLNIVNPNAEIREGFESFQAETRDGRTLFGFLAAQTPRNIVLRTPDGQSVPLDRDNLQSLTPAGSSLMPEGLLADLSDQQVRDLFAYLRSTQPLND
jgi:putative heme-binding domain-containing protein